MCLMHCSIRHVLFTSPTETARYHRWSSPRGSWRCRPHLRSAAASMAGPWEMSRSPESLLEPRINGNINNRQGNSGDERRGNKRLYLDYY
jgi:hypothetical protein